MVADFSVENYYSIRSRQTLSFVPTTDKGLLGKRLVLCPQRIKGY